MSKWSRVRIVAGVVGVIAAAVAGWAWFRAPATSRYDDLFPRLRIGMSPADVTALLGPPTGPPSPADTVRILADKPFDDVDAPPLKLKVVTAYWYDGRDRRIRVEFADDNRPAAQ